MIRRDSLPTSSLFVMRLPFDSPAFAMRFRPRFSLFTALCGAVIGLAAILPLPQNGAILALPSLCPFHNLTGLPCPGCGLTRSFVCCAHGQITAAFAYHPLGPILFGGASLLVTNALLGRRAPRLSNRFLTFGALLFGVFWILRLGGVFPFPAA